MTGVWHSGKIAHAARESLLTETKRRYVSASGQLTVQTVEPPESARPAQAAEPISFSMKLKALGRAGPKAAARILIRRFFRLPLIGYVMRVVWLVVRLPTLTRGIFDWQRANDLALQGLWRTVADVERNREIALQDLTRIVTGVEQQGRDADQVLRTGMLELRKAHDALGKAGKGIDQRLVELRRFVNDLSRKQSRPAPLAAVSPSASTPASGSAPSAADVMAGDDMAAFYMAFEDRFRGPREQVKEWQGAYLSRVADAVKATGGTILDVGCGRGEWLELLKEKGFAARGVDLNDAAAEECRRLGLDVATGDALATMNAMPEGSLAVVSAFHVIEHLPLPVLFAFLDEAFRALKPGGIIILETPNPGNLQVGAHKFWLDLTHLRPLPAETVAFAVESRGFAQVEILPMHPNDQAADRYDVPLLATLNQLIYGPQDYAVVARK